MEKFLVFPAEEYQTRAYKARKLMAEQGLDACVFSKSTNLTYFSGYYTYLFGSDFRPFFFVLPLDGDPVLVVPELERDGALRTSWVDTARTWGNFARCEASDPIIVLANVLRDLKLENSSIGVEMCNGQRMGMTWQNLEDLKNLVPAMKLKPSDSVAWPCRRIKSSAEIELMRRTCYANDLGWAAAVEVIREGATEKEAEIAMCRGFLDGGATPTFMVITSGAARNSMANPVVTNNVMKKGDFVCMDFGCNYSGYISDVTRGVFIGEPSKRAIELYKAVTDIHHHAIEAIKPGEPVRAIDEAVTKRGEQLGYSDLVLHRAGHALGLEIHELPSIAPTDYTIMEPGMVLAVEPNLYEYNIGAIRIEDNIVVTETGCEILTNSSRAIIVK